MDLLNMTNRAQIHEFYNISKIMAVRPKKHRDMGCEYHYSECIFCFIVDAVYFICENIFKRTIIQFLMIPLSQVA